MSVLGNINANTQTNLTEASASNSLITVPGALGPNVNMKDPFWYYATIQPARWNQSYPYQLIILNYTNPNYPTAMATFTMPIPPQSLGIDTPFAITTQVVLGGIVEQHNGTPIRTISLSGTTGVWPGRTSTPPFTGPNAVQAVVAGGISAIAAFTGQGAVVPNSNFTSPDSNQPGSQTGYYQFQLLQQFLESYVTAKKTNAGRTLRLAFAIWKDQAVYLVTPGALRLTRSAESPWEYSYNLQMRAWKRINYNNDNIQPVNTGASANIINPLAVQQLIESVSNAQASLQGLGNFSVFQAALGATTLLENLRSMSAWGKDQVGQAWTCADLPDAQIPLLKGPILNALNVPSLRPIGVAPEFLTLVEQLPVFLIPSGSGNVPTRTTTSMNGTPTTSTVPPTANQNTNTLYGPDAANPISTIFANPKQYYKYFSTINTSDLNIPPHVQAKITAERNRLRAFTRQDFANMLASTQAAAENFADICGSGDPTFNITFNRQPLKATRTPSDNDFEVLFQLNAVIMQLNPFAAYNNLTAISTNPMDYAAGFYSGSQIPFQSSPGKFLVPFPYGSTLEVLSNTYLGTPDRWEEIAMLNSLREPYVDEVGFTVPLLTNGSGSQITVANAQNLETQQLVYLYAGGQPRTARHIVSITPINGGSYYLIVLDGTPNLSNYTTAQGAYIQSYLPGTVNSQMSLYIPSSQVSPTPEYDTVGVPGLTYQQWYQIGGVDLLLTSQGDLVVTPDGDCRLAIGITNVIQSVWLAFNTPKGSLLRHPGYGFPKLVGTSIADVPATTILAAAKGLFDGDPTFTGVQNVSVNMAGPTARVVMGVGVAGSSNILPVAFDIH